MKRLISILVVVAMMFSLVASALPVFATEGEGEGAETPEAAKPLATYNVNWKTLVEEGTMRSQWLYDKGPSQNNMASKYAITATDSELLLAITAGDHRQYYSEVMFDLTDDTNYIYEFEAKSTGGYNGGAIFAYSYDNPLARDEDDSKKDINGNDTTKMASSFILMGNLNGADSKGVQLKFGGHWDNYGYEDSKNHQETLTNIKVSEDGYSNYRVVYTGRTVEFFYLNANDEWVELYADATITLCEGAKVAFGAYTNNTNYLSGLRNCVVYGMNEAAKNCMPDPNEITDALVQYKVNWKTFVDGGAMRAQWLYDKAPNQNNMASKYAITATDTELALGLLTSGDTDGDHRQYYSEQMFTITADTKYVYDFEAKSNGGYNGGTIFAYADDNPLARDEDDSKVDIDGNDTTKKASAYILMGNLNGTNEKGLQIKYGGHWADYGYEDSKNLQESPVDLWVSEEGYSKYRIVYTGYTVEIFYLNTSDEFVKLYADAEYTITLCEGAKLAFGAYTNGTNYLAGLRNCTIYGMNEAAKNFMVVDKTALEEKIAEAKALVADDYTVDSWNAFYPAAIDAATAGLKNAKTQVEIDAALDALKAAMAELDLSPLADKTELNALIAVAKELLEEDYYPASWVKLQAAIVAAEAIAADETLNQTRADKAVATLVGVIEGLVDASFESIAIYNVNWKFLVENKTMRAQWAFDRGSNQNNFPSTYNIDATETGLIVTPKSGGDNRSYYSEYMFKITDNTYYTYEFQVSTQNYGDGGLVFAWAADANAPVEASRPAKDATNDIYPGIPKGPIFLKGQLSKGKTTSVFFGGPYDPNIICNTSGTNTMNVEDIKRDADGYATYKIVYNGRNVEIYYVNTNDEYVQTFTGTEIVLPENSFVAFGITAWTPDYANVRNAVVNAYNLPSAEIMAKAWLEYTVNNYAKYVGSEDYTPATTQAFNEAYANAQAVLAADFDIEDVAAIEAAQEALDAAVAGLKKPANKTTLAEKIAAAEALMDGKTAEDFEEVYFTPFYEAYENAVALNADVEADQADVDAAAQAIADTIGKVVLKGELMKTDLNAALDAFDALNGDDYTPNTWAGIEDLYAAAAALKDTTETTQAAIDEATKALNDAIAALVKRANVTKLDIAVGRAEALNPADYKNWDADAIAAAIEAAKAVVADLNVSQADADAALEEFVAVIDALETIRDNVLLIVVPDDYEIIDTNEYDPATATYYNKLTDMSYHGLGNVFYYDYHKVIANKGFTAGEAFPQSMKQMNLQGDTSYCLRIGRNSGGATNRGVDGIKVKDPDGTFNHASRAVVFGDAGKIYNHVFGYSFRVAPTFDSFAFYLPIDTPIASIDVYGANRGVAADGSILYGKADADDILDVSTADRTIKDESAASAKKVYLGTVDVPAAEEGAENIYVSGKLDLALEFEYVYFAVTFKDGTNDDTTVYIYEVELYGFDKDDENRVADFSAITELYTRYLTAVKEDYTEESWNALVAVVEAQMLTINSVLLTQEEVDAAVAAIQAAFDALKFSAVDFAALNEAIANAAPYEGKDATYTPKTYAPFLEMLAKGKALVEAGEAAQTEVDAIAKAINDAIAKLAERADKTALKEEIDACKLYKEEAWQGNTISWRMFAKALGEAEALLADDNAVQAEVDAMVTSLQTKKAVLMPTPGYSDETETTAPETDAPATDAPATDAPATDAPATDAPATDAPATEAPETDAPATEAPETDAPATEAPETDAPATEAPETDAPATEAPETDAPATEAPETDAPATEAPETDDESETEAPTDDESETEAPTDDESETAAPETEDVTETETETDTEAKDEGGCGSSIAISALAVVGIIGTAVVIKKKED